MKILVTGGLGYIGAQAVVSLCSQGYIPVIIDNLDNSLIEVLKSLSSLTSQNLIFHQGDIRDKSFLGTVLSSHDDIAGVIHFAAHKAVGESVERPLKYYNNNIVGLIHLCEVLEDFGVANFVFSSSCTVYGEAEKIPVTESSPRQLAASPYGHTKLLGEDILQSLSSLKKFRVIALRYFNPIGAHDSAQIGELPQGIPQNLVPYVTQTAVGKRHKLKVFGNDYRTPDGTAIRDYIHVMDLADAHVKALDFLNENPAVNYETFNIGTGKGTSVLELIHEFERVNGLNLPYELAPRRAGDITAIYADPNKAHRLLGWQARRSLPEALRSAWLWELELKRRDQETN